MPRTSKAQARNTGSTSARDPLAPKADAAPEKALQPRDAKGKVPEAENLVHSLGEGIHCDTERRGFATPEGRNLLELVFNAPEGVVPLWAGGTTLNWRFQERSMLYFQNPEAAKGAIRQLFGEALVAWGDALPVRFTESQDLWDFEIVMSSSDNCNVNGSCVLARAFFPDAGRHDLLLYPRMFTQSRREQVDTLIHELGHVFGLRHFFAELTEARYPFSKFGRHNERTIMNYGELSELTDDDRNDLRRLYRLAWSGSLREINGTPIRFVQPYHTLLEPPRNVVGPFSPAPASVVPASVAPASAALASAAPVASGLASLASLAAASYPETENRPQPGDLFSEGL